MNENTEEKFISRADFDSMMHTLESALALGKRIRAAEDGREKAEKVRNERRSRNLLGTQICRVHIRDRGILNQIMLNPSVRDWDEVLRVLEDVFPGASWHPAPPSQRPQAFQRENDTPPEET